MMMRDTVNQVDHGGQLCKIRLALHSTAPMDFGPFALTWPNILLGFLLLNKIHSCESMHITEGSG